MRSSNTRLIQRINKLEQLQKTGASEKADLSLWLKRYATQSNPFHSIPAISKLRLVEASVKQWVTTVTDAELADWNPADGHTNSTRMDTWGYYCSFFPREAYTRRLDETEWCKDTHCRCYIYHTSFSDAALFYDLTLRDFIVVYYLWCMSGLPDVGSKWMFERTGRLMGDLW